MMNKSLRSCSQIIGHWETFPLCPMFVFNKLFTKSFQIFHYNCLIPFHCKLHPSIKGPGHFLSFYANFPKWLSLFHFCPLSRFLSSLPPLLNPWCAIDKQATLAVLFKTNVPVSQRFGNDNSQSKQNFVPNILQLFLFTALFAPPTLPSPARK